MSRFKGKNGAVLVGANVIAEMRSFSVEESASVSDATVMGDDWEEHEQIVNSWSGSAEVFFDDTDTNGQGALSIGSGVAMSFQMEGNTTGDHKKSGNATVTGFNINSSHDGIVEASIQFTGNGALAEGTVT